MLCILVTLLVCSFVRSADSNAVIFENHIAVERGATPSSAIATVFTSF